MKLPPMYDNNRFLCRRLRIVDRSAGVVICDLKLVELNWRDGSRYEVDSFHIYDFTEETASTIYCSEGELRELPDGKYVFSIVE